MTKSLQHVATNGIAWLGVILISAIAINSGSELSRKRRFLIWEKAGGRSRVQVIAGFGIPVDLKVETVIIGTVMKANYKLPMNVSDYNNPGVVFARKKRSPSRWDVYDILAQASEMRGFGDGKSCVLRAICELSSIPIDRSNGLFDELAHLIFNPTTTKEDMVHHTNYDYLAAKKLGSSSKKSCEMLFPACKISLTDIFTL